MYFPSRLQRRCPYEADLAQWALEQAFLIRTRERNVIDWDNIAEELDSLGRSQKREARSRLARIVEHLVKLDHSADPAPREGWRFSVRDQRFELDLLLADSPSLRLQLERLATEAWPLGVARAAGGLHPEEAAAARAASPLSLTQLLDPGYFGERDQAR